MLVLKAFWGDPVSPPLCSIINSSDQEPSLWPFSLADIPESFSCNPPHSTRRVSALPKHTSTIDLALLEPFHTLSRAHQWWVFSGDIARKAYRAMVWAPVHLPGICSWVTHARDDVLVPVCWAAPGGEGHKSCLGTHKHHCKSCPCANAVLVFKSPTLHCPMVMMV